MSSLHIQLFGAFQVTVDDQPWDEFRSDKVRALLAYLALEGATPRRRLQLMALLWSGFKPTFARANLRMTLANLRQLLAPFDLLQSTRQAVRWYTPQANWTCDALALDHALQDGNRSGAELWQTIEVLYQGEFLPGFEQIDSLPWQLWLQDRRAHYAHRVDEVRQRGRLFRTPSVAPDWGAIPRTLLFHGRIRERRTLRQWLIDERCNLVAIFGIGGQGKTTLAAAMARDLAAPITVDDPSTSTAPPVSRFTHVIWRSLSNAPSLSEILLSWLQILTHQQITSLPPLVEDQLALLIRYLQEQPMLLVLDNLEHILQNSGHAGCYQPGYEAYGELLRRIAASDHQSCLMLVGREQPQEFRRLQTQEATIRALHLQGLEQNEAQQLLQSRGLRASTSLLTALIQRYAGHPLALQVATETIQEFFGGKLADFLVQAPLILADLRTVLDQHFTRLSHLEQTILICLAIEEKPITRQVLLTKLIAPPPLSVYLEAERSLLRRLQLETYGEHLSVPSLMRTYLIDHLVSQIYWEMMPSPDEASAIPFSSHSVQRGQLVRNESRTVMRPWASRAWIAESYLNRYRLDGDATKAFPNERSGLLILQAVAEQLVAHFGQAHIANYLYLYLNRVQQELATPLPGYVAINLRCLLRQVGIDQDPAFSLTDAVADEGRLRTM